MNHEQIKKFIDSFSKKLLRTIVIVDFSNVEKWKESLNWKVGIQELAVLAKNFSKGGVGLRRFYYGSDYGNDQKSTTMTLWSGKIIDRAKMNRFDVVTKRVKYIHSKDSTGFTKKCDLDVEMAVDLIKMKDEYDNIVVFSGDGDLFYVLRYLKEAYGKSSYVFGARNHIGAEMIDAANLGIVDKLLFIEDFEYRLNMDRFRYK